MTEARGPASVLTRLVQIVLAVVPGRSEKAEATPTRFLPPSRWAVVVVALFAVVSLPLAGCGGDSNEQGAQTQPANNTVVGTFVGNANPSEHGFVAIVATAPREGGQARDVRAYLCDPLGGINEWFRGSVTGNQLNLTSENGARLTGSLARDTADGSVTLADGRPVSFTARLATGHSGLYEVRMSSNGRFTGTSDSGARVEGQVAPEGSGGGSQHLGGRAVTGTLTAPSGESRNFEIGTRTFRLEGRSELDAVFIVSETHIVGGTKQGNKAGLPFVDPYCLW